LRRIADFLGIAPFPDTGPKREHPRLDAAYPATPTPADFAHIANLLAADLREFSSLTGLDISSWRTIAG
jgi:hypothetical protein